LPQLIDAHYTWNSLDELKQALGQVAWIMMIFVFVM
jgi:hypothetical protein